jgi:outer membrane protein assembly factor BamB
MGAHGFGICPGVVPVFAAPLLQVLVTIVPALLLALGGALLALFKPSGLKNAVLLLWRLKIAIACLTAIGVGLYFGARQLWPRGEAGIVMTERREGEWTTTRFDLRRCGVVPGSAGPMRKELIWQFRSSILATPAVVGNRVYIASAERGISKSGQIYCLDADTGAVVWANAPPDYRPTFSSPVIAGDYLVCGEGLHDTRDARVVCLDLRDEGKVVWTFRTNNHVECTPVVANGRVYVGAGDDGFYCLDLKPGPDGQAVMHWHKPTEDYRDAETSLAVHDGKVYAGLGNEGEALTVLDAVTGAELHRLKMPYPVFSPAAIADGKLYIGMGNGDYVKTGEGGAVRCLDLKTLQTDWSIDLPKTVMGSVAVKDDKLYFGCCDGQLYCLSKVGKVLRKFDTRAAIKTSPAVTELHTFIVNDRGRLFALDRHTLEPVWDYPLGSEGYFLSSPVVAADHVYVGADNDGLLCVGKAASTKQVPHWFAPQGGPGIAGNSDSSPLPDGGEIHWLDPSFGKQASTVAPLAIWENHVFAPRSGPERGVACLPLEKDARQPPRPVWTFAIVDDVESQPVILGNTVACVDGKRCASLRSFYLVDRLTGKEITRLPVLPEATGILTATPHQFLVQDHQRRITSFDEKGNRQWTASVGHLACPPAANDALILVATEKPPEAIALDRATGTELWRQSLPHAPTATPILERNSFWLATQGGLDERSLLDGRSLASWTADAGIPSGELATTTEFIVFVNQKGEVIAIDRSQRKVTARVPGALRGQTPLVSRRKVICAAPGRLISVTLGQEDATPELWLDLSMTAPKDGLPTGPLLLRDSRIFTVLPGHGLACLGGAK